jgi:tetratricopeptide (TPR) repeat protein
MNSHDELEVADWLRKGIAAAKAGKRDEARKLLLRVVEANERSEQAWLWLSGVVDSDDDRLICLENVLALNPENVQARSGVRFLQERGLTAASLEGNITTAPSDSAAGTGPAAQPARRINGLEPDAFLEGDGCVYCGRSVGNGQSRCPYCKGRLITKQFKNEERSPTGYLLHAYWIILVGIDLVGVFLIGFVWDNIDEIPDFIQKYLSLFVGPVLTGDAAMKGYFEPDTMILLVRLVLLGLAIGSGLVAVGLFLRRPNAHIVGLVLIALNLLVWFALFLLGYLGYAVAAFGGLYVVALTIFMFNTVEDFSQEERREWLRPDKRLVNDADYFTRGRAYEKRGMWAKALLHWRRAIALNPRRDTYYAAAARAYARLGRYDEALGQMDQAVAVSRTPEMWYPMRDVILEAQRNASGTPDVVNPRTAQG